MKKNRFTKLFSVSLSFLVVSFFVMSGCVFAETLKIGIGISKPPYVIQEHNAGAEYEIVERALKLAGYEMKPRYIPLLRIGHEIKAGVLDGGMNMRAHLPIEGYFSEVVMNYHNYAVTRADSPLKLHRLNDLSDKSVLAFQNAQNLLGDAFNEAIKNNDKYFELTNQALQVRMLDAGRVEVVIADFRIFLYFKKEIELETGEIYHVKFHRLFEPTPYRVVFKSRHIRDLFDKSLLEMKQTGEYDRILAKYISPDDIKQIIGD